MPFIGNIGPGELLLLLVIILVIFGPGRLPEIGNAVGKGIREFRKAASDVTEATRLDAPPATPATPSPTEPAAPPPSSQSSAVATAAPSTASAAGSMPDDEAEARRRYEELKARFERVPADESHDAAGRPSA